MNAAQRKKERRAHDAVTEAQRAVAEARSELGDVHSQYLARERMADERVRAMERECDEWTASVNSALSAVNAKNTDLHNHINALVSGLYVVSAERDDLRERLAAGDALLASRDQDAKDAPVLRRRMQEHSSETTRLRARVAQLERELDRERPAVVVRNGMRVGAEEGVR